jgi:uncharacterized protein YqgC (DUF456 family)
MLIAEKLRVLECKHVLLLCMILLFHCIIYQPLPSSTFTLHLYLVFRSVFSSFSSSQIRLLLYMFLFLVILIQAPEVCQDIKPPVWFSV